MSHPEHGSGRDVHRLSAELRTIGYSILPLPRLVRSQILDIYAAAASFFALADAEQRLNSLPEGCGFWPFGVEHSGRPDLPDRVGFFAASPRTEMAACALPSLEARELHQVLMAGFRMFEELAEELVAELMHGFAGPARPHSLKGALHRWSMIQVSQTIPTGVGETVYRSHEDGHLITFAQADSPGLEIAVGSRFLPAPRSLDSMLIMPGKLAELLTGGQIKPMYHRVRALNPHQRLSILFFADIDPDRCEPWVSEGADAAACKAHVLTNAARFGMPGFGLE